MENKQMEKYVDELSKRIGIKAENLDELKVKGLLVYRLWRQENLRGFSPIGKIICKRFKLIEKEVKWILEKEKRKYYKRNYRKKLKEKTLEN